MKHLIEKVDEWMAHGDRVALATVLAVKRSAPFPSGAKMAVNDRGQIWGAVSGGCVDGAVIEAAEEILAGGEARFLHFGIADSAAWDVGLPCGGEIDIFVEALPAASLQRSSPYAAFAQAMRTGERAALVTAVRSPGAPPLGSKLLVSADGGRLGSLGNPSLDECAATAAERLMWSERSKLCEKEGGLALFVDVTHPPPRLVVFGAVDYARALVRLARSCGWRPYVVDPRARFATHERFPDAEDVVVAWPDEAFARLAGIDRATYIAVLTHDPKLDDAVLEIALRSDAAYVGAMGSHHAHKQRRERLVGRGLSDEELGRLAAPIGLDLGAVTAEETALSILAEVVAVRYGRVGGPLSAAGVQRIHEVGA